MGGRRQQRRPRHRRLRCCNTAMADLVVSCPTTTHQRTAHHRAQRHHNNTLALPQQPHIDPLPTRHRRRPGRHHGSHHGRQSQPSTSLRQRQPNCHPPDEHSRPPNDRALAVTHLLATVHQSVSTVRRRAQRLTSRASWSSDAGSSPAFGTDLAGNLTLCPTSARRVRGNGGCVPGSSH